MVWHNTAATEMLELNLFPTQVAGAGYVESARTASATEQLAVGKQQISSAVRTRHAMWKVHTIGSRNAVTESENKGQRQGCFLWVYPHNSVDVDVDGSSGGPRERWQACQDSIDTRRGLVASSHIKPLVVHRGQCLSLVL